MYFQGILGFNITMSIQNTIDFQFFSPIQFNKKFNKKFWDKIQFNKIFNKKILHKIQFKTLFNSKKLNSKNYSISKISRIFNSKFDSKYWNWQDSIQQYIHSIRKRGYRSPLSLAITAASKGVPLYLSSRQKSTQV